MPPPAIAAVIPAYNATRHIAEALDSVARQTVPAAEVIVVDDGSADDTSGQVMRWREAHPAVPVQLVRQPNSGPAGARNTGWRAAKSEWVAFLDADDVWRPEHNERLWAVAAAFPEVDLAFADATVRRDDRRWAEKSGFVRRDAVGPHVVEWRTPEIGLLGPSIRRVLVTGSFIPTCSTLVRRAALAECGGFDTRYRLAQDRECWLKLIARRPPALYLGPVAEVRYHAGNATHPTRTLRTSLFRLRLNHGLSEDPGRYALDDACLEALAGNRRALLSDIGYRASREGLFTLLRVRRQLAPGDPLPLRWKDWGRAVVWTLLRPLAPR